MLKVRFEKRADGQYIGYYTEASGKVRRTFLGTIFDEPGDTEKFLDALEDKIYRSSCYRTHGLELHSLRKLTTYFRQMNVRKLPLDTTEWRSLINSTYEYHFNQFETIKLERLTSDWTCKLKPIFFHLREIAGLIPSDVKIPPKEKFRLAQRFGVKRETMIDGAWSKIVDENDTQVCAKQLLNLDTSRTDAEYLEGYRNALTRGRAALEDDARAYLESMAAHYEYGQHLLKLCTDADAKKLVSEFAGGASDESCYHKMHAKYEPDTEICATDISLARVLRFYRRAGTYTESIRDDFKHNTWLPTWQTVKIPDTSLPVPSPNFSVFHRFCWMMGYVNLTDMTMVHLYVSLRNPVFNPIPLSDSTIVDKYGRSNFSIVVDGVSFVVDKWRARAKKRSSLDAESFFAIDLLLRMTREPRKKMGDNDPMKTRLFIKHDQLGPSSSHYTSMYLFSSHSRNTLTYFPRALAEGILAEHISPMRIRRSTAVLEWLRTGSVTKAARKIGNTTRIVIRNYIPAALLAAWNARLTRRFQNLSLVVAAGKEDYLLESTDFSSEGELKAFIVDMLNEHRASSSRLAAMLHECFDHPNGRDEQNGSAIDPNSLIVPVCASGLGALYAFSDYHYEFGIADPDPVAPESTLVIQDTHVVDLADLLFTRLSQHHDPTFREAHRAAEEFAASLAAEMRSGSYVISHPM
ncbi:hypothetical protein [Caballeronia sp. S22]|uniref:hypothetical protein n=1 Tax=Caballeronia sp. S22 TaxID=3137182 RepID=UPI003531341B